MLRAYKTVSTLIWSRKVQCKKWMYHGKLLRAVGASQVFSQSRSRQQMEWNSSWKYWMLSPSQVGGSIKTAAGRSRFVSHEYARGSIHSLDLCMDAQAHKSRKPPAWFPSSRIIASRSPFCPRPVQLPDESHECRPRLQAAMEEPDWNHERATSTHKHQTWRSSEMRLFRGTRISIHTQVSAQ